MKKGFTLIEILISSTVLIIVLVGIFYAFTIGQKVFFIDSGLVDLQQAARQAMDGMVREIRQAKQEALRPLTVSTTVVAQDTFSFYIPDIVDPVSYTLQSGQITRSFAGATSILASNITSLSFCCQGTASCTDCDGSRFIRLELRAQKTDRQVVINFPLDPAAVGGGNLIEEVRLR